jgi:UDP-2,3-diacylglucosamine hydrolase
MISKPSGRFVFVSDLHIQDCNDEKAKAFLLFLDQLIARPPRALFLLGDIFDLWLADRRLFVDRYRQIWQKVRTLVEVGVEVHYFEGNHDLDLEPFWGRVVGCRVHLGPALIHLGGLHARIEHGDEMDPEDRGYLWLRWWLRTGFMRWLGRSLPDAVIAWIGTRASHASRAYTTDKARALSEDSVRRKIHVHVERMKANQDFRLHISGHVHLVEDTEIMTSFGPVRVVNLGTWLTGPPYRFLEIENGGIQTITLDV